MATGGHSGGVTQGRASDQSRRGTCPPEAAGVAGRTCPRQLECHLPVRGGQPGQALSGSGARNLPETVEWAPKAVTRVCGRPPDGTGTHELDLVCVDTETATRASAMVGRGRGGGLMQAVTKRPARRTAKTLPRQTLPVCSLRVFVVVVVSLTLANARTTAHVPPLPSPHREEGADANTVWARSARPARMQPSLPAGATTHTQFSKWEEGWRGERAEPERSRLPSRCETRHHLFRV